MLATTGITGPAHPATLGPLDFGPRTLDWMMDQAPALGPAYAMLAADVDADGNDLDGLLHPEVTAPLATYPPWNLRGEGIGGRGEGVTLVGAMLPFPVEGAGPPGDRRRSIADRYASRQAYLDQVRPAIRALIADRLVLAQDEELMIEAAGQRYDLIIANGDAWRSQ